MLGMQKYGVQLLEIQILAPDELSFHNQDQRQNDQRLEASSPKVRTWAQDKVYMWKVSPGHGLE